MTDRRMYDLSYQVEEIISRDDLESHKPSDVRTLDEFEEKDVEWLIKNYLPKGQITLICGTGGTGKTSVWTSLLASISSGDRNLFDGTDMPGERKPATAMFFSAEDTVENVIKKKLRLNHANMKNILTMSLSDPNFERIKFGSKYLEDLIAQYKPALCVFDPLQNFIDGKIKMSDRNAMRQHMRSLIEWGQKYGTTFLIVMHTNKQSNVWGRSRMADSADLWDIARCVWMVGDADTDGLKYLSHEKSNYGVTSRTMLFRNTQGIPTFDSWCDKKDRDFVAEQTKAKNALKEGQTVQECCTTILSELADNDEITVKELNDLLINVMGYKTWLVKKAKAELKEAGHIAYFKRSMNDEWHVKKTQK